MNENKFLLAKGISGLGNRMECALTGLLYARLAGRRLLVDWSDDVYSDDGSNVFHRFFQCSLCSPDDEIPKTDSVSPNIWRGHLRESAKHMRKRDGNISNRGIWRKFSIDLTKLDYQEDVLVMWTPIERVNLLRGHFKGAFEEFSRMSKESILRKLLRDDLTLHPEIGGRVDRFKNNGFGEKTVGVHVRYTDHRTNLWTTLKKLNALLRREPGLQIFLATDNLQIKNMFEENYPNVITTPHSYPTPGLRLHEDKNSPSRTENGFEALVDLYLLAECDYLIIDTSSSFSYIAKLLTKAPVSNVINVRRRGKRGRRARRLTHWFMLKLGLFSWGLGMLRKFVRIQRFLSR